MPAALSPWPMFDLTEPMAQNCLFCVCALEGLRQTRDLDGIAQGRARAMRFDVTHGVRGDARPLQRVGDHLGLGFGVGHGVAVGPAAGVDHAALDHAVDVVTVGDRPDQGF